MEKPGEIDKSGLLDAILTSAEDYGIIVLNPNGRVETWNPGAQNIFGFRKDEVVGRNFDVLFTAEDRAHGIPEKELETASRKGRADDYRWHQRKDGSCFWADGVLTPMKDPSGGLAGYVKILRDATEKRAAEMEIARLARVDPLTGLANRAEFDDRFKDMTAAAGRHKQLLILQLVDLDHFKQVNDRFGHHVGDQLLRQAAKRIDDKVRETDFVARIGGDEFVVLQPDAGTPEVGGTVAEKLIEALAQPFQIDGLEVRIGVSVGISVYPHDATEPDQLLRKADLALYKVKEEARNGYHYFTQELDSKAYKRSRELAAIRRAASERRFSVRYQPKIAGDTGRVAALEALLRCDEPELADYPIEEVVDLAMEAGLMEKIGLWLMSEATSQLKKWQDSLLLPDLNVCVNLCATEMADPGLPAKIATILARSGVAPKDLEVEITEREMFDSGEEGLSILARLRAAGTMVAIDDFGTGYSSLSYLSDLPVDKVKLDRSFLRNIPESGQACAIAMAIIDLVHGLGLKVVVEGVETAAQADYFQREHSDLLQGYFFSPPLPAAEMTEWLSEHASLGAAGFAPGRLDAGQRRSTNSASGSIS